MGQKHNQDYYKVAGSDIESRGMTKRHRDRLTQENARLQREASKKKKPPATPARKRASAKKTAKTRRAEPAKSAAREKAPIIAEVEAVTARVTGRGTKKKETKALPPAEAEVVDLRRERAAQASSVAPRVSETGTAQGRLEQAARTARAAGRVARKGFDLALDVVVAPITIARLVRRMRERES